MASDGNDIKLVFPLLWIHKADNILLLTSIFLRCFLKPLGFYFPNPVCEIILYYLCWLLLYFPLCWYTKFSTEYELQLNLPFFLFFGATFHFQSELHGKGNQRRLNIVQIKKKTGTRGWATGERLDKTETRRLDWSSLWRCSQADQCPLWNSSESKRMNMGGPGMVDFILAEITSDLFLM